MARYVLGDGGHGRLISAVTGAKCLGINDLVPPDVELFIGVGDLTTRITLFKQYESRVIGIIDESALFAGNVTTGVGLQLLTRAVVICGTKFGANVLVNTGAQLDHDCRIGNHCIIAPRATLCGEVTLGDACVVGAGSIILQGVTLDANTFVPAGTLVVGPDDFRRPQSVVRSNRAYSIEEGAWAVMD